MVAFYAHWKANCVVTFDARGGSPVASVNHEPEKPVGALPTPTRAGYTFKGWFTSPLGADRVSANTIVLQKTTYYAQWTANPVKVKVTFDANKGKVAKKAKYTVLKIKGDKLGKLKKPTRKGYKFKGWYTKKKGGKKISSSTKVPGASVKYYAQWKKK
jgi:uncharacterized repeat protein (TIGR02543 family)